MTNNEAIKELLAIIEDFTDNSYEGKRNLIKSVKIWAELWLVPVSAEISVTNTQYLSTEYEDYLKYKLCELISETLAEECAEFNLKEQKISAKILGIRRLVKED